MNKLFRKILLLFFFITLTNCGYQPIMSEKNYNFDIIVTESSGNDDINKIIKNYFERFDGAKAYYVSIQSRKNKTIVSKDSKGNPSVLEIQIIVNYKILDNETTILERELTKNTTYNNINDKFELSKFEKTITKNLSKNVAQNISTSIFSLIK